ncbi:hypothetical protein LTR95_011870 [Oleoguttula sp. CCFEE 5521]
MEQPTHDYGGQPFKMQGLEDALPLTQPQQYLGRHLGGQHIPSGGVDQYGRQIFYGNAQAAQHPSQYGHHAQHPGLQPGYQHYGPQYAMPAQQYQRPMLPGMQHPQMYLPPGNLHAMHGVGSAPMMPTEWRHSQTQGRCGPYSDISSMSHRTYKLSIDPCLYHNAHNSPQSSPGIFSTPRGPPRKPRQSGFALWVGNLPPAAGIADLKDHFSRDATKDIESLFLISKSNCAFVNYRTETTCSAAMHRFHDSRFNGIRLVCRLRKGASTTTSAPPSAHSSTPALVHSLSPDSEVDEVDTPAIVGGPPAAPQTQKEMVTAIATSKATRVPESFFILKSLTSQDLDASIRRGEWTTQVHNEAGLNDAFERAENVYLVFSANKSGEYFGYARMLAPISGDLAAATSPVTSSDVSPDDGPRSIPTPATATAPSGRIIDDSARGTIFWEADDVAEEGGSSLKEQASNDLSAEQELGRPFRIEWISTGRLPFFRTRGLRNAWNANREVKIARDGTELEPVVGRKLMLLFHGVGF